jgi:hypothetical protein
MIRAQPDEKRSPSTQQERVKIEVDEGLTITMRNENKKKEYQNNMDVRQ